VWREEGFSTHLFVNSGAGMFFGQGEGQKIQNISFVFPPICQVSVSTSNFNESRVFAYPIVIEPERGFGGRAPSAWRLLEIYLPK